MPFKQFTLPGVLTALFVTITSPSINACMAVRGPAPSSEDYIQSEQAVIFWDETHHIEHFIRQADIRTDAGDIGFLVPTPSIPELVEVDPAIFRIAAEVGHPNLVQEVRYHTPWNVVEPVLWGPAWILHLPFVTLLTGMSDRSSAPAILSEQDVAGYHATILAATDAEALSHWLRENNYEWPVEGTDWLKPYVDGRWTITAFKLIKPSNQTKQTSSSSSEKTPMITRAVRMTFATDKPFYPYSEPSSKREARNASPYGRALRVAFLSSQRMQGDIPNLRYWPGDLIFAGSAEPPADSSWRYSDWLTLAKLDGRFPLPSTLTYWLDQSNPRRGNADVYFSPDPDQTSYRKSEIDYSKPLLNRLDLTHWSANAEALLACTLLTSAPFYCAWWLIRRNRELKDFSSVIRPETRTILVANRVLGLAAIVIGGFNCMLCIPFIWIMRQYNDLLPGKQLPGLYFNSPVLTPVLVSIFFWTLIYCGFRTMRLEPAIGSLRVTPRPFDRWFDYAMAAGAIIIGVGYLLALIGVFIARLMPDY